MRAAVFGTNHILTNLETRELWIEAMRHAAKKLSLMEGSSCVLLITCNRCEIYFSSDHLLLTAEFLKEQIEMQLGECLHTQFYMHFDERCFLHLALVSSGLDSPQIGETDIRRQVRQAYEMTRVAQKLPHDLHFLFQKCLKIGKQFISLIQTCAKSPTLETLVVDICKALYPREIFLLGNSQINRKILHELHFLPDVKLFLCSRHSQSTVSQENIIPLDFSQMHFWKKCEIVICASDQSHYLINPSKGVIDTRLFIDLSVPRSVNPLVEKEHGIPLLNMEHLNRQIALKQSMKEQQIQKVKEDLVLQVQNTLLRFQSKSSCCLGIGGASASRLAV